MKRLVLGLISLMVLIGLNGCSDKPEDSLNNSIQEYKECMINNDYKCQAELTDKSFINAMGGINTYIKTMKALGMKITNIKLDKPSKIIKSGNTLSSLITYSMTAIMQGQEITTRGSLKAVSNDNGSTWFFQQVQ
jgi:hypothetical protein